MLVFLRPLFVGDGHSLTGQFSPAELADPSDDVGEGSVGVHRQELSPVVAGIAVSPGIDHLLQMHQQQVGGSRQVGRAASGIGAGVI